ncbi:MAG: CDP-alcohol phosphatidyltransferase family protein [Candidatus Andersenbacteria bacterium]|nr:CDP-alcohol phosphatidyltransferase family protein [Candidatus Andersenbacteria bacterium]
MTVTYANAVTAFRLLLLAQFVYLAHAGHVGLSALAFTLAWGLDAVDGLVARWRQQVTPFGYVFDKAVDRLVLVGSLFVLVVEGLVPLWSLLLLTKDVLVIPVVVRRRMAGLALHDLGAAGKAAAVLQGAVLLWVLAGWPYGLVFSVVVALVGAFVAYQYTRRAW